MGFQGVLYAVAVLLILSTHCSATPLFNRENNQSTTSFSVPNAGHLTCSTESYPDLDRSCVLASIEHFCHDHAGYQFPANATERSLRGKYTPWHPSSFSSADQIRPASFYVEENVTVPAAPIYLSIIKPAGGPYAECSYKLDAQECIAQMTEAIDSCNKFDAVSLDSSGTVTDATCGWRWEVDLSPRPLPPAPFEYNSTIGNALAKRDPNCYHDGFAWPRSALQTGMADFCTSLSHAAVKPSISHWDMDFYYYFSKDGAWPRKAYFNIATFHEPFQWTWGGCFTQTIALARSCQQWGLVNGGSDSDDWSNWLIDNDPDLHRPGQVPDQSQWVQGQKLAVKATHEEARAETADPPANAAITPSTALLSKRQSMSECFQTGYQFPLSAWNEGLDMFCGWADGRTLDQNGEIKFTFWWWDSDGQLHKQWYDFQTRCPLSITHASCLATVLPLVTSCGDASSSRAGWASDQCLTVTLDNDPDHRRPGEAIDPPSA
ncbi:hypothetical protein LTR74_014190 [Friedmanniomyces endolithicus]|nr:hypothetical protein LTR74_014190 [Friedmanniomyces endolithicus]